MHISANNAEYTISRGTRLSISILGGPSAITYTDNIGLFTGTVSGTFLKTSRPSILNKVYSENSYVMNDTLEEVAGYVAKGEFTLTQAQFSMYFRSRVSLVEVIPNNFLITVTMIKLTYLEASDGSPVNFPVSRDEWTLRLRRDPSIINETSFTTTADNSVILTQTIDGVSGSSYSYPSIDNGMGVTVRLIVVPILLTI